MRLGEIIRDYRLKNNLTMNDFARLSGISKPYVSMLEANKNSRDGKKINPSVNTLQKISHAIAIPLNDLLRMIDGEQVIDLNPLTEDDETKKLIAGYNCLDDEGKRLIMSMISQLNFSRTSALVANM